MLLSSYCFADISIRMVQSNCCIQQNVGDKQIHKKMRHKMNTKTDQNPTAK